MNEFSIRFWGVRGSYPVPGQHTLGFGGNTSCVEVRAGEQRLILDAGTGIIPLGQMLARTKQWNITLLLSHLHHDHTQGFPFFAPAYVPGAHLKVFGPATSNEILNQNQSVQVFPVSLNDMNASKEIHTLRETDVLTLSSSGIKLNASSDDPEAVTVSIFRSHAHPGGVHIYRIGYHGHSLVYATDTEGYVGGDRKLAAFAKGADVLIHDAQYSEAHYYGQLSGLPPTQGFGHSTPRMACELAKAAGVRELLLFHHDPGYSDETIARMELEARNIFPHTKAAREGMEVRVDKEILHFANRSS
jgi:ribonuclease BN (tRNA processing enzyme)